MKKFFALLIAAAMLCCMAVVPAAADGVVTFTAGTVNNVNPGDAISVPVSINGDYEAHSLTMHVRYNAEFLTVTSVTNGEIWSNLADDAMKVKDFTTNPGDVAIGITCPTDGMTGSGVFFTINFTVAANCTADQAITIDVDLFSYYPLGGQPTNIPFNVVNGAVVMADQPTDPTPVPVNPTPAPGPVEPGQMSAAFAITPRTVAENEQVISINLSVSGNYCAHTMNVAVDYDPEAMELIDVQRGAALNNAPADAAVIIDCETYADSVRLGLLAPTDGFTATGVLLTLTFKVCEEFDEEYPDGTLVTVAVPEFDYMPEGAANGTAIPCTVAGGIVVPVGGDEPNPTDGPGPGPGPGPNPPPTGAVSFVGLGILAIVSGAGAVLFRKKED